MCPEELDFIYLPIVPHVQARIAYDQPVCRCVSLGLAPDFKNRRSTSRFVEKIVCDSPLPPISTLQYQTQYTPTQETTSKMPIKSNKPNTYLHILPINLQVGCCRADIASLGSRCFAVSSVSSRTRMMDEMHARTVHLLIGSRLFTEAFSRCLGITQPGNYVRCAVHTDK
jgi:hypothetical protein